MLTSSPTPTHRAVIALLIVTIIWGLTFTWMKEGLDAAREHFGPGHLWATLGVWNALRFGLATILLPIILPNARRGLTHLAPWRDGSLLGLVLAAAFFVQMAGLDRIDPAVSAFLTSLYVVGTALLSRLFLGVRHRRATLIGVGLATVGASVISGPPQLAFGLGESLTALSGLLFAIHILLTDIITARHDSLPISTVTFASVTVASLGLLLGASAVEGPIPVPTVLALFAEPAFILPAILCSTFGSAVAITLVNHYQRVLSPVRAAILYALEPVWASGFALAMGAATLDIWLLGGGLLLLGGNLIVVPGMKERPGSPGVPSKGQS